MIFISILTLIVAKALPFLNNHISPIHFTRISALIFLYSSVLTFNMLYIQSIGSGIGIYSGLFQVTVISQFMELFLYLIGFFILIAWPLNSVRRIDKRLGGPADRGTGRKSRLLFNRIIQYPWFLFISF